MTETPLPLTATCGIPNVLSGMTVYHLRHIHELRAQGDHFYDNGVDNKWLESLMETFGQ